MNIAGTGVSESIGVRNTLREFVDAEQNARHCVDASANKVALHLCSIPPFLLRQRCRALVPVVPSPYIKNKLPRRGAGDESTNFSTTLSPESTEGAVRRHAMEGQTVPHSD